MTAFDSGEISPPASHPADALVVRDAGGRNKLLELSGITSDEGIRTLVVMVRPGNPEGADWQSNPLTLSVANAEGIVQSAPAAGRRHAIDALQFSNSGSTAVTLTIKNDEGADIFVQAVPASTHGNWINFSKPLLAAEATGLVALVSGNVTGGGVIVNVQGHIEVAPPA